MTWVMVQKKRDPHVCDKPYYAGQGVDDGDIIRCTDCNQAWLCTGKEYGVQWDPFPTPVLKYERVSLTDNGGR